MKQHSKIRGRVVTILILLLLAGVLFLLRWSTRVTMYSDEAATGNTSTNLLNGGLFAKSGDKIYFANPYDQNSLYSMNLELGKVKKVYDDYVSYINASGKYIFYTRRNDKKGNQGNALFSLSTTGLYRIQTNGHSMGQLYRNPTQTATLFGNNIYYQHYDDTDGLLLYRVGIDGKEDTLLLKEGAAPNVVMDNTIYYTGTESDHNIHKISTQGDGASVICEGNFTGLSYANGYLYCLDMANDYTLCRLNLDGSDLTHLTQERVSTYNVSTDGSTVYFQVDNGDDNGLYALDIDSGSQSLLRSGNFNYYHVIDDYLFFEDYDGSSAYVMDTSTEQISDFLSDSK
jgi:hypothetical protein